MSLNGTIHGMIAREVANRPDAHVVELQMLREEYGDGINATRVTLRDAPLITKGPNAGRPNWRRAFNEQTMFVTQERIDAWVAEWEAAGNCATCVNTGEVFVRWNHIDGTTMKPCPKCHGAAS